MNDGQTDDNADASGSGEYQVLARKYRPTTFEGLIGQDALVRTLTNAFASNRLHHAFVMTGVRGVGKTSTARIIARALNCIGPDGTGGPTTSPCGVCEHCVAIAGDRHVDVLEMDAASNTGVDNIRELIDGVRYRPASARYKVYIIDEVHMLSKSAFNALLKTLEEPPEQVVFIFATTEIRKVPITVLSRCQRFDLRRVPAELLAQHFGEICKKEGAEISDGALHIIARAADGSVRDGLSLLDQAIAHADGAIDEEKVRAMLGMADRTRTFDLLELLFKGEIGPALEELSAQYVGGSDPASIVEDMLELVHWLTKIKVHPAIADAPDVPEHERVKGKELAEMLRMPVLTRAWQILLKGLSEVRSAPSSMSAAEMLLVRFAYAADLPTPGDTVKAIQEGGATGAGDAPASTAGTSAPSAPVAQAVGDTVGSIAAVQPQEAPRPEPEAKVFPNLEAVAALAQELREGRLAWFLETQVRVIRFEQGTLEINAGPQADRDLVQRLKAFLEEHSNVPWSIALSAGEGAPTLSDVREENAQEAREAAASHPVVKAVLDTFPGSVVEDVRHTAIPDDALPSADDDTVPTE